MTWHLGRPLLAGLSCLALSSACVSFEPPYEIDDSAVEEVGTSLDEEVSDPGEPAPEGSTGGTSSVPPEDEEEPPPEDEEEPPPEDEEELPEDEEESPEDEESPPEDEEPPEEGLSECPEYCLGGCIGRTCLIQCIEPGCKNESFECAPEMSCDLVCIEDRSCQGVELHCREGSSCSITCVDEESCQGLELFCTFAECEVDCEVHDACRKLEVECKEGAICHADRCDDDAALTCDADSSCSETEACLVSSDEEMDDDD